MKERTKLKDAPALWVEDEGWATGRSRGGVGRKEKELDRARQGVQITSRDIDTIGWITEQYAVRTDVIRWLLSNGQPLSESRTRAIVARWQRAGLVESRRFFAGAPNVVWPTREGTRLTRSGWRVHVPTVALLAHTHAVSVVRLALERSAHGTSWVCERTLFKQRTNHQAHVADGVFRSNRDVDTAVEVELTVKSADRLRDIIRDLTLDYGGILYVVGDHKVGTAVQGAVDSLGERDKVSIVGLDRFALTSADSHA
jgi:hypothetical protein